MLGIWNCFILQQRLFYTGKPEELQSLLGLPGDMQELDVCTIFVMAADWNATQSYKWEAEIRRQWSVRLFVSWITGTQPFYIGGLGDWDWQTNFAHLRTGWLRLGNNLSTPQNCGDWDWETTFAHLRTVVTETGKQPFHTSELGNWDLETTLKLYTLQDWVIEIRTQPFHTSGPGDQD